MMLRLSIIIAMLLLIACAADKSTSGDFSATPGDEYLLSPAEIKTLAVAAEKGDLEATYRLIQHYSLADPDLNRRIYWQKLAAQSGHLMSMLNLSVSLNQKGGQKECQEAMQWIARVEASTQDPKLLRSARLNRESLIESSNDGGLCAPWLSTKP
jgi:TPR repeat protein